MPGRNIVVQTWPNEYNIMHHPQMLHEKFDHFKFEPTSPNMLQQHVAIGWPNAHNDQQCCDMLRWDFVINFRASFESGLPYSPIRDEFKDRTRLFLFPITKHLSLIAYFGKRTSHSFWCWCKPSSQSLLSNAIYFKTDEFKWRKCVHQSVSIPFLNSFSHSKRCLRAEKTLLLACPWELYNNYSMSPRWIWSDKITNERVARVGYNHFISNKGEWNNCFSKFSNRVLPPIFISTILQSENF